MAKRPDSIVEIRELAEMPFDKRFGSKMLHGTGYEVRFKGDETFWLEFYDPEEDEFKYGN